MTQGPERLQFLIFERILSGDRSRPDFRWGRKVRASQGSVVGNTHPLHLACKMERADRTGMNPQDSLPVVPAHKRRCRATETSPGPANRWARGETRQSLREERPNKTRQPPPQIVAGKGGSCPLPIRSKGRRLRRVGRMRPLRQRRIHRDKGWRAIEVLDR